VAWIECESSEERGWNSKREMERDWNSESNLKRATLSKGIPRLNVGDREREIQRKAAGIPSQSGRWKEIGIPSQT
jgi:hypothetical protein